MCSRPECFDESKRPMSPIPPPVPVPTRRPWEVVRRPLLIGCTVGGLAAVAFMVLALRLDYCVIWPICAVMGALVVALANGLTAVALVL